MNILIVEDDVNIQMEVVNLCYLKSFVALLHQIKAL